MAIDKDFVIKNGIEVNENLLYADADTGKVGIGTTEADKKLVVIGDAEVSSNLSVGTTITAENGVFSGILTAYEGLDIGLGGTFVSANKADKKIGINTTSPRYTLDVIGPVSTGTTAEYIYGDLEVTGNIKASNVFGQVAAGGTVVFEDVTVLNVLDANNAEVYTKFNIQEVNSNTFRYLTAGDPPGIGFTQNTDNPELYLQRAAKYEFHVSSAGFPFYIKTTQLADLNDQYSDGVVNNGAQVGVVTFKVPFNAPNKLYYQASNTAGMGGTIYINNDYKDLEVGVLTVTKFLDSKLQADFENIYVSGIGTINNLKGPQNFSVSAGILTVRQDQTALIGVSTGADRVSVQEKSDDVYYLVPFTETLGIGSNYQNLYVDSQDVDGQLKYNPSVNTLIVDKVNSTFSGNVTGVSTGSNKVKVSTATANAEKNILITNANINNDDYAPLQYESQKNFTYNPFFDNLTVGSIKTGVVSGVSTGSNKALINTANGNAEKKIVFVDQDIVDEDYAYLKIDSDNKITYNPQKDRLTATNIAGAGDKITNLDGDNITQGTVKSDRMTDATTSVAGVVQLNDTYPPVGTATTIAPTINVVTQVYNKAVAVIPAGTQMLFCQAAAPTGWTQNKNEANVHNKALRVVKSAGGGGGGSQNFTTTFNKSRSVPLLQHAHNTTVGNQSANHKHTVNIGDNGLHEHSYNGGNHSHGINDDGHKHTLKGGGSNDDGGNQVPGSNNTGPKFSSTNKQKTGININEQDISITILGNGKHTHGATVGNQSANHNHTVTIGNQGTAGASMNFEVKYIDVILCKKDAYT